MRAYEDAPVQLWCGTRRSCCAGERAGVRPQKQAEQRENEVAREGEQDPYAAD